MSDTSALWPPVISAAVTAIAGYISVRLTQRANVVVAEKHDDATVQVARIEACSATEGHLWELLAAKDEEVLALRKEATAATEEAAELRAKLIVQTGRYDWAMAEIDRLYRIYHITDIPTEPR